MKKSCISLMIFMLLGINLQALELTIPEAQPSAEIQAIELSDARGNKYAASMLLIDASPTDVWVKLNSFKSIAKDIPGIKYNALMHRIDDNRIYEGRFDLEIYKSQYTILLNPDRDQYQIEWDTMGKAEIQKLQSQGTLVRFSGSALKRYNGFQILKPHGKQTVLYHYANLETAFPMPEFTKRQIQQTIVQDHMLAVKKQAEQRSKVIKPNE